MGDVIGFDPYAPRPPKPSQPRTAAGLEGEGGTDGGRVARDRLRQFVERIETLMEDKKVVADDIKAVFAEAKCDGYDAKVLRRVIAIRAADPAKRAEFEAVLETYLHALGMIDGETV